jgi:hypothetical protein
MKAGEEFIYFGTKTNRISAEFWHHLDDFQVISFGSLGAII